MLATDSSASSSKPKPPESTIDTTRDQTFDSSPDIDMGDPPEPEYDEL